MDHKLVRAASQRAGVKFKLDEKKLLGIHFAGRRTKGKITWADVRWMRRWAAREGYGMLRAHQARFLASRYRLAKNTVEELLTNNSWHDPSYRPGEPDISYWGAMSPAIVLLHVITNSTRSRQNKRKNLPA